MESSEKFKIKYSANEEALRIFLKSSLALADDTIENSLVKELGGVGRISGYLVFNRPGVELDIKRAQVSLKEKVEMELFVNKVHLTDFFDENPEDVGFYVRNALDSIRFMCRKIGDIKNVKNVTFIYSTDAIFDDVEYPRHVLSFSECSENELGNFYAPLWEFREAIFQVFSVY